MSSNPDKFMKINQKIYDAWFEAWLLSHLPLLTYQPKWFVTSHNLQVGDVVLFLKEDSRLQSKYQYGIVDSIVTDQDGIIRKAKIKYRNNTEITDRFTNRAVRELVVIHAMDEIDIGQELGEIAMRVDAKKKVWVNVKLTKFLLTCGGV